MPKPKAKRKPARKRPAPKARAWPKPRRTQPPPPKDAPLIQTRAWSPRGGAGGSAEGGEVHEPLSLWDALIAIAANLLILAIMVCVALFTGRCAYEATAPREERIERLRGRYMEAMEARPGGMERPSEFSKIGG